MCVKHDFQALNGYYTCTRCGECETLPTFTSDDTYTIPSVPVSAEHYSTYYQLVRGSIYEKVKSEKKKITRWSHARQIFMSKKTLTKTTTQTLEITGYQIYTKIKKNGKFLSATNCLTIAEFILNPTHPLDTKLHKYGAMVGYGAKINKAKVELKKRELYKKYHDQKCWNPQNYQQSVTLVQKGISVDVAFDYYHLDNVRDSQRRFWVRKRAEAVL
jgi:hypothetical protein